jgi:hypothetical protein
MGGNISRHYRVEMVHTSIPGMSPGLLFQHLFWLPTLADSFLAGAKEQIFLMFDNAYTSWPTYFPSLSTQPTLLTTSSLFQWYRVISRCIPPHALHLSHVMCLQST